MTPAARLQAAIDILDGLERSPHPADRFIRDFFRARRYAGSKDRAAVAERVFQVLRHRFSLAWAMQDESPRALVLAAVARDGGDPDTLFTGQPYAPAALTDAERKQLRSQPAEAPLHVEGEFPAFIEPELTRAFGDNVLREMTAFLDRAPTDLRVNTLKASRTDVLRVLTELGYDAAPTPYAPSGVRIASGGAGLDRTREFQDGLFEFQDEAAQIASVLVAPRPGERILDMAAGAGGKSLALAALSNNEAASVASDIRASALDQLRIRATRAGAQITVQADPEGPFDAVLLDAPCTGTGTWRRQPELRGRLTPALLAKRIATQDELLDRAARLVKHGGRLIYATCSTLPSENQDRIAAFRARHPEFVRESAAHIWTIETGTAPPPGMAEDFRATPRTTQTDGFYTATLIRRAAASGSLDKEGG
jgi:16S rRNA (cytosine967-C5)-methyltransferase